MHDHPNFDQIKDELINGFDIGVIPNSDESNLCTKISNFCRDRREYIKLIDVMIDELNRGYIEPTNLSPSYIITLFCVPKKDEFDQPTKLRLVRNGSHSVYKQNTLNDIIDLDQCKMPSLPTLTDYATMMSNAQYLATKDLSNWFRQILARKSDAKYLIYSFFA